MSNEEMSASTTSEAYARWTTYLDEAESTALYPESGTGSPMALAYVALGMVDEWYEHEQTIRGVRSGNYFHGDALKEFGDRFWYLARLERELLQLVPGTSTWAQQFSQYNPLTVAEHTFWIAGKIKKMLRQDKPATESAREIARAFISLRSIMLSHPQAVEAMDQNAAKLLDRMERGVIKGSGDNR